MSVESLNESSSPATHQRLRALKFAYQRHVRAMLTNFCVWSFALCEWIGRRRWRTKRPETQIPTPRM